jgi:hypothetical protein
MTGFVAGGPGPRTAYPMVHKAVMLGDFTSFLPGGGLIDGAKSRDPNNTLSPLLLNPGLLMGQVTSTKRWAPSIIGINQSAYTSGGTSVTVTAAQATEIVRRVGATGNLLYIGPPSAAGTVAVLGPIAYSAINTGTGVITTATLGANLIAGGFVAENDGTAIPKSFIFDGTGHIISLDSANVPTYSEWPQIPVAGEVMASKLSPWPSDTSLRAWVMAQLSTAAGGKFDFDANYQ